MAAAKEKLHFIFNRYGFQLDTTYTNSDESIAEFASFVTKEPLFAIYNAGFKEKPDFLDAAGIYLYNLADMFLQDLTSLPGLEISRENTDIVPDSDRIKKLLGCLPFVPGTEYVNEDWIIHIYSEFSRIFRDEIRAFNGTVQMYLAGKSQHLKAAERVFFHLVENKNEPDFPFAFLATYATKDENGGIRHLPLKYALTEYETEKEKLLNLLSCLNKASEVSPLIAQFVESGEMFYPLRLTAQEAYELLCSAQQIEDSGIVFRIPNWWKKSYKGNIDLNITLGGKKPSYVGMNSVIDMVPSLTFCGEELSDKEIADLLEQTNGLAMLKGRWVAVNRQRLQSLLDNMKKYDGSITLIQALRMEVDDEKISPDIGALITNGEWLNNLLVKLREPAKVKQVSVPRSFKAKLRPYQKTGCTWLDSMSALGFGCCLADDMGLGKTVQVLAFLEHMWKNKPDSHILLIVPASLIGNWKKEKDKFAPDMPLTILHGISSEELSFIDESELSFLNITTYGMAARTEKLTEFKWDCVICDEAQAIKNPGTKQTKQIKKLQSGMRIAMTGTPIENNLTNLWSIFDFLDKGLLGTSVQFRDFCKSLDAHPEGYAKLKNMISPFMLRRVKTDKNIISDLPDKLEQVDSVELSKKQIVLYRKYVSQIAAILDSADGIERKGLILSSLVKLKQICNHPDQYLGQESFNPKDSGKFLLLGDICETIYEKRERVLVFTQFKEIIPYLDLYLSEIFHCRGVVLHGSMSVKERNQAVEKFQSSEYVPYMVLSVKAGGTGLNLTKASHVIHFDRWWNPAVENQATDRAYRIGQKNNVIVHKLVCTGTIEEKIDALIESKKELSENVIGSAVEKSLTEMSNSELMSMMKLEI
ncbi:MAG: DEAD/DEAH box helicase [Clostridia bacterium]|nr:DEAD/DEAH box helicase [Clostridia bacterium]